MSGIADSLFNIVRNTGKLRFFEKAIEKGAQKEISVALATVSNSNLEIKSSTRSFSHYSGITARVGNNRIHIGIPSQSVFFPILPRQRKYKRQFQTIQVRTFFNNKGNIVKGNNNRTENAGGDIGDKAGGNINKIEIKGNYTGRDDNKGRQQAGRDIIHASPFSSVTTGIKVSSSAGLILLFAAIMGWLYCENYPEQQICKSLRSRVNTLFE